MKNAQDDRYLVRVCKDKSGKYFIKRCFNDGAFEMDEKWENLKTWVHFDQIGDEEYIYSLNRENGVLDIDPDKKIILFFISFMNKKTAYYYIDKYDPFNIRDIIIIKEVLTPGYKSISNNYNCEEIL